MGNHVDYVRKKYAPLLDKTLQNALANRIASQFPRIGGRRIRQLCAEMVLEVVWDHLRPREHLSHGQVLWTALHKDHPLAYRQRIADSQLVAVVLDLSVAQDIESRLARRSPGELLRRKAVHDVGTSLTHKRIICWKRYAEGKDVPQIARETYHSMEAVDRYLGQYDRVRHCRLEHMTPVDTAHALDCSVSLVNEYLDIDRQLETKDACSKHIP